MSNLEGVIASVNRLTKDNAPNLTITWKPWGDADYQVKYTDICMGLETPHLRTGETLVSLWINVASIPCSVFTEEGLTARDEAGSLALEIVEEQEMGFPIRRWKVCRDTVGSVGLTYRFYPRVVPSDYRFRPYYDFRNEMNGVTTTGVVSLVAPKDQAYHIHIKWDLSQMPANTRAVSVRGEGDYDFVGHPSDYQFTMYAFGKINEQIYNDGQIKIY